MITKIITHFNNIMNFLSQGVWSMRLKDLSGPRYFLMRQLRIYLLAIKGFYEDKCQLRASALTFYSLLSVVPVLAMFFGIAKGFGMDKLLEKELTKSLSGQEEVLTWLIQFANKMLENTKGTLIAGLGFIILFWAVIKVLSNIEEAFNDVWQIKKGRSWGRKFSDYTSIMIFGPILLIGSSAVTVFIKSKVSGIIDGNTIFEMVGPLLFFLINLIPYILVWVLFTIIYVFMPNTRVSFKSGMLAGVIAGTIYQILQIVYIEFQGSVTSYNAVYGSFAALPLFLMWLQLSWLVVLFGAEISFAEQNVESYEFEAESTQISYSFRRLLNLIVVHKIVHNFNQDNRPYRSKDISQELELPIRLTREILFNLVNCGLISELITDRDKETAYAPAFDISVMSLNRVINSLEEYGSDDIPVKKGRVFNTLTHLINEYKINFEQQSGNVLLKDVEMV
ncbi:YihY/virulence factor BrkB family protein [Ancylomarina euxinus]|uniref:YihY/virulence factor BrkB family protein n=1 Tax=Ancylomarina euxinus TaxID=2283627 RepID=A0A425Y8C8_9BACT|nr:YihY/virulence factor BrkB family protein [Ancylomarina euxinus]MCZ4693564.1 YihY/virulence factor BrkB family protein [Ancylomarina euxinus]MUP13792.1 YihY family inner membrane protein [Ancylomarina euxinus]RRG24574.1 YihY/virulence factor BrkB family protein [Ancylomarina euxinus]